MAEMKCTKDGKIYINGVLRLEGPSNLVSVYPSGNINHVHVDPVMRLETGQHIGNSLDEQLDPITALMDKNRLEMAGFFRQQDGVWRKPSASGSSGTN